MLRIKLYEIVPYEVHPHVAIIKSFAGIGTDDIDFEDSDDDTYLQSLDPKDWKTQDHYAVLGLRKVRFNATADDIRRAYRRKLLTHHPDKRRSQGEDVKDESHDYFSCITIAYEILGNPTKRHAYDCVDPVVVNDSIPSASSIREDFFGALRPFFTRKARWSKRQPVPGLGYVGTSLDDVHAFYDFWENYDTTRDYSFLDEEDKDKGEDRETRRAIERQNRAERARRRGEELRTIRQVLELAKANDPRLLAAVKAVKDAKAAKRQARLDAARKRREEEEERTRQEAEAHAAERAASEERKRVETERLRKEREQLKQETKRERKRLRAVVVEKYDHFIHTEYSESALAGAERVQVLADLDLLCQRLTNIQLQELNDHIENTESIEDAKALFSSKLAEVKQELQAPGLQSSAKSNQPTAVGNVNSTSTKFTPEMIQTLIKAVNLLPAGTPKRWEAIAAYINQHVPGASVTGKEALKQAKALSQEDATLRKEANAKAFVSFKSTVRETDAVKNVIITNEIEAEASRPWTVTEQRALEQALRSCPAHPADGTEGDRWQRIADIVGTRTRRECMLRCKELAEQVRAKKAAVAATKNVNALNGAPASQTELKTKKRPVK
ncbi:putative ribosome-associated chaperone zuotin translation [Fasciola hepatica]|uniref:Ribosome-associated chaperone zuotin translation n=1 Tax=Fasciola hepatica TaxID=6192 RepID=A0A4E0RFV0_FASHE|nr:putative ribosome-associated chaperone zuotin translation [Fasciola hepatica]